MEELKTAHNYIKENVMIEWVELGEGICGDYDSSDPEDIELLRFDVSTRENEQAEWEAVDDASYCTQFPASATEEQRIKGLELLMGHIYEYASSGNSIKKLCEYLSWISLESIATGSIRQYEFKV